MCDAPFTRRKRALIMVVATVAIVLGVAAEEAMTADDKVVAALYEAAKKDGRVTIYSPQEAVLSGLEAEKWNALWKNSPYVPAPNPSQNHAGSDDVGGGRPGAPLSDQCAVADDRVYRLPRAC